MIELQRFQLPLATVRSNTFDFERASLALLAKHKHSRVGVDSLKVTSEWREPAIFRHDSIGQQGAHHHG
jgi:hypothetical protein